MERITLFVLDLFFRGVHVSFENIYDDLVDLVDLFIFQKIP